MTTTIAAQDGYTAGESGRTESTLVDTIPMETTTFQGTMYEQPLEQAQPTTSQTNNNSSTSTTPPENLMVSNPEPIMEDVPFVSIPQNTQPVMEEYPRDSIMMNTSNNITTPTPLLLEVAPPPTTTTLQPSIVEPDEENNRGCYNDDDDDDDDDMTIIGLDEDWNPSQNQSSARAPDPLLEQRRHHVILTELERVQRASFFHFFLLCLVPTALLLVVVLTLLGDDTECFSPPFECEAEARTFMNAFTSRCVCNAILVDGPFSNP